MTPILGYRGASSALTDWLSINWKQVESHVFRLQIRIAKAVKAKRWGKVQALQRLVTRSYQAKLLAVRRVTTNPGRNTPGVDGIVWKNAKQKWEAVQAITCRAYRSQPLRRLYIPKKNGKKRPLGIPTMFDRALQALFLLAYEPVAEATADLHSYGFRPKRSTADAIERCFVVLAQRTSAQWVLEGDIKGCFDHINHDWMLQHISVEHKILQQWLKAGLMEKGQRFPTQTGTPQGGIISPCLANGALDGMEKMLKSITKPTDKVHLVRYADDFVITGNSKELLENTIKPAVTAFLWKRGLTLSEEKTLITSATQGFDFLGFNVRKYGTKLLIKPSKSSIKSFLASIKVEIKKGISTPTIQLIQLLNRKIIGWANYYRHVVAKETFNNVDTAIFQTLYQMIRKKHPRKSAGWIYRKYYTRRGMRHWLFHARYRISDGEARIVMLKLASDIPIRRHRQIISAATPYDVEYLDYFENRVRKQPTLQLTAGSTHSRL
jgi:RNA-directed DNA polymerase